MADTYHIVPENDTYPHFTDGRPCNCNPKETKFDNGNLLITHNSYDGRELLEVIEAGFDT